MDTEPFMFVQHVVIVIKRWRICSDTRERMILVVIDYLININKYLFYYSGEKELELACFDKIRTRF
jgi:hypothetical protein